MRIVTINNLKGGVGKTTSTVNLAYSMSRQGKKVLVVDADPQTNLTPFFTKANQQGHTLLDVLEDSNKVRRCIYRSKYSNIDIIKGNPEIHNLDVKKEDAFYHALELIRGCGGMEYDYCIIDTRPSFDYLTEAAVVASDILLTPVCLDKFCRDNLALVDKFLDSVPKALRPTWKIFATKVDSRRRAQRNIYEDLYSRHDYPFLETCISRSAVVDNALELYRPVGVHRSGSHVVKDYMELAREVIQMEGGLIDG